MMGFNERDYADYQKKQEIVILPVRGYRVRLWKKPETAMDRWVDAIFWSVILVVLLMITVALFQFKEEEERKAALEVGVEAK